MFVSLAVLVILCWLPLTAGQILRTGLSADWLLGRPLSPRQIFRQDTAEYRPHWAQADLERTRATLSDPAGQPVRLQITEGIGRVRIERWEPRRITIRAEAQSSLKLLVGQLYYPGWTANASAHGRIGIAAAASTGLIELVVPSGSDHLELILQPTASETWGRWISGISLLFLVGRSLREATQ